MEALISLLESTENAYLRLQVAEWISEVGPNFTLFDPGEDPRTELGVRFPVNGYELAPRAARALEVAMKRADTVGEFVALSKHFTTLQSRRIWGLHYTKIAELRERESDATIDEIRLRMIDLFYEGHVPEFLYSEFPEVTANINDDGVVRFVAFGDFGSGTENQFRVGRAIETLQGTAQFDFGITLGDNFMPSGLSTPFDSRWRTEWEDVYGGLGITFYPVLGNHDYRGRDAPLAEVTYSRLSSSWEMPAPNYVVRAGSVDLFAIDTNIITEDVLDQLDRRLRESRAKWKIVYGHHYIYTSGFTWQEEPNDLHGRLLPILQDNDVDIYINGHNHVMEEWFVDGIRFVTLGTGGMSVYDGAVEEGAQFRAEEFGFGVFEFSDKRATIDFVNDRGQTLHTSEFGPD